MLQVLSAILPLLLFRSCHDSQEGYLLKLTYDMGTTPLPPDYLKPEKLLPFLTEQISDSIIPPASQTNAISAE